jgi:tRNA pseudouridine38-40 synthase
MDPGPSDPSNDELYEVLSNRRRRYVIHALDDAEEPMELGELADQIAEWETGDADEHVSADARKSVYTSLQQSHLPKMDDVDVVEFDKDRGVVDPTPKLDELDVYIEFVEGNQIPWHHYYLGLFARSATLLGAVWLEVWPSAYLSDLVWAAIVTPPFGVSAVAQTVAFDCPEWCTPRALNGQLPADVRAWASAEAPPRFHATHDATRRAYTYHLYAPPSRFADGRARDTLDALSGEHDFHNLTTDDEGTVRTLETGVDRDGEFLVISVAAGGFPRHLVRRLVALVRAVGSGSTPPEKVDRALAP